MPETPNRPSPTDMIREDVEHAVGAAGMATHLFAGRHSRELKDCTEADRDGLLVRFAVTWLLANDLVVTAPDSAFEQMLPMDLPEVFAGDVGRHLHEAIARKAHFDGIDSAARMRLVPDRPGDWME